MTGSATPGRATHRPSYLPLTDACLLTHLSRQRIDQLAQAGKVRRRLRRKPLGWLYNVKDLEAHCATAKPGKPAKEITMSEYYKPTRIGILSGILSRCCTTPCEVWISGTSKAVSAWDDEAVSIEPVFALQCESCHDHVDWPSPDELS